MENTGQVCCTARLLKEIGVSQISCQKPVETNDPFSVWYANLFLFNRRKCILFFNPQTMLSAFALYVKKPQILNIQQLLRESVETMLDGLEIERGVRVNILRSIESTQVRRTSDKSVLACMVQVVYMAEWSLSHGLQNGIELSAIDLSFSLNTDGMVKYKNPVRVLQETISRLDWDR